MYMTTLYKAVHKLAHEHPGEVRKALVPVLRKHAKRGETWWRTVSEAKDEFIAETLGEAMALARDEGFTNIKSTGRGEMRELFAEKDGNRLVISYSWSSVQDITGESSYMGKKLRRSVTVLSMDPSMVAAEFFYAHHQGLVP